MSNVVLPDVKVPYDWVQVLQTVNQVNPYGKPHAVIAGGCLRDMVYERPIKDVDVWISTTPARYQSLLNMLQELFDLEVTHDCSDDEDYRRMLEKQPDKEIYAIAKTPHGFELILGNFNVTSVVDTFDFSINQIMFDGNVVQATPEFIETRKNNVISQINDMTSDRRELRMNTLSFKYPEMKFKLLPYGDLFK